MAKIHFQRSMFCKQSLYALLISNDQMPLEAYCTNMKNQILSKGKSFRADFKKYLKGCHLSVKNLLLVKICVT